MKDALFIVVVYTAVILSAFGTQVYIHEHLHVEIYDRYGCEETDISYSPELVDGGVVLAVASASNCPSENIEDIERLNQVVHIVDDLMFVPVVLLSVLLANQYVVVRERKKHYRKLEKP